MCYAYGSSDHATGSCPMCKVYKPSTARCPHVKEVCRNSTLHPRHDVVYLKNAEVQTFNGCGFCKWANWVKENTSTRLTPYQNPGWPGCCRPPAPNESKLIGAADWPAVSVVHHVPIPPQIKSLLDSVFVPSPLKGSSSPTGSIKAPSNSRSLAPSIVRRTGDVLTSAARIDAGAPRSPPATTSSRARSGGSPHQASASLGSTNATKEADVGGSPKSAGDNAWRSMDLSSDRRGESYSGSNTSPGRRNNDLGGSMSRRSIEHRPSLASNLPAIYQRSDPNASHSPGSKNVELGGNTPRRSMERRPSLSSNSPATLPTRSSLDVLPYRKRGSSVSLRMPSPQPPKDRVERSVAHPIPRRTTTHDLDDSFATISVSGSSSSSGSNSDTTVISDGAFTDYLSDESEAELQRQAEVKAALAAQNQMEEMEFKAARQQLASVDLRPPRSWAGNVNTPRSQTAATRT